MSNSLLTSKRVRLSAAVAVVVVAAIVAVIVWKVVQDHNEKARAQEAADDARVVLVVAASICKFGELADKNETLTLTVGSSTDDLLQLECLYKNLDTPTRVTSHVENTRAVDGRQVDEWKNINASWTYHPDDGLNMTLSLDE